MAKSQSKRSGCLTCLGVAVLIPIVFLILAFIVGSNGDGVRNQPDRRNALNVDPIVKPDPADDPIADPNAVDASTFEAIPGLNPADVYEVFADRGFELDEDENPEHKQWIWSCKEQTTEYDKMVLVRANGARNHVTIVMGTCAVPSVDDAERFLGLVAASIRYDGSRSGQARAWVIRKLGRLQVGESSEMTIGAAKFGLIHIVPRIWTLLIWPAETDSMRAATDPKDSEEKAEGKLTLAKKLLEKGNKLGEMWLREIVEEFPGTTAAQEAQELLNERPADDDPE